MRNPLTCILWLALICLSAFSTSAQTYPFTEGFSGITTSLPAGWQGDMRVMTYHGMNEDKGLVADLSSLDPIDSAITPLIGPLTAGTEFYFWYQIIDQNIYPSTPTQLRGGASFRVQISEDGLQYIDLFVADSATHLTNLNYVKKQVPVAGYAGKNVYFKLLANYGTGSSFFVDVDSIKVRDAFSLDVERVDAGALIHLYPNPVANKLYVEVEQANDASQIALLDVWGRTCTVPVQPYGRGYSVEVEALPDGWYFLQVAGLGAKRIMIQH